MRRSKDEEIDRLRLKVRNQKRQLKQLQKAYMLMTNMHAREFNRRLRIEMQDSMAVMRAQKEEVKIASS
jgi:hypothetical protein